jgi:hypothetical protein
MCFYVFYVLKWQILPTINISIARDSRKHKGKEAIELLIFIHIKMSLMRKWTELWVYKQNNRLRALSPQSNYTDWATAICWRNFLPTFADRGVLRG